MRAFVNRKIYIFFTAVLLATAAKSARELSISLTYRQASLCLGRQSFCAAKISNHSFLLSRGCHAAGQADDVGGHFLYTGDGSNDTDNFEL